MHLPRRNMGLIGKWWRTVDRVMLAAVLLIVVFGVIMVATASPAVAERIGLEPFYFIKRQILFLIIALGLMFSISLLSPLTVRRLALGGCVFGLLLLIAVLLGGAEAKGAKRWLYIGGFSLQPSEFMKPCFAVLTAWILAERYQRDRFPAYRIAAVTYGILVLLLILQPDFGMVVTVTAVWAGQLFIAGLPYFWLGLAGVSAAIGIVGAYTLLPHVAKRINSFLDPEVHENYQVNRSLEAFSNGGFLGTGPGEGTVKQFLPDSHTDFIFAVIGEEFGMLAGLLIISVFGFIVIRGLLKVTKERDLFVVFAVSGILMQFGLQALINMGVTMNLLPTKGMTLPLISYGGSSTMAVAIAIGMVLALTKRRYGNIMVKLGE